MSAKSAREILEDPDFRQLCRRRMTIAWTLTLLQLALFFGFVALVSFDKPFLARRLGAGAATTLGIPIAVGVILASWGLTGIYVRWANTTYDGLVRRVREKVTE